MAAYVFRDGALVDKATGFPLVCPDGPISMPRVMRDVPEYRSPINGALISSRSQQREDLKRSGSVLAEPRRKPRGYRNPNFARKRGLALNEE